MAKTSFSLKLFQERLSVTVTVLKIKVQPLALIFILHNYDIVSLGVDFAGGLKLSGQLDPMSSQEDDDDDELEVLDITED